MNLELSDQESDFLYRLLYTTRPMSEIESIIVKMRREVARMQEVQRAQEALPPPRAPRARVRGNGGAMPDGRDTERDAPAV